MAGEGKLLRTAREEKGWSLYDAEEITKIRVRYLKAMEEENYEILPGAVYVKGFLRNYSKNLDLNPEEIVSLYKESTAQEVKPALAPPINEINQAPRRSTWVKPITLSIVALIILGVTIGVIYLTQPEEKPPAAGYTPTPLPSKPETPLPNEKPPVSPPSNPQTTQKEEGLKVGLSFTENCWIRFQVDGGEIKEQTFLAGTNETLQAKDNVKFLTIGNAGGLKVTVNGKELDKFGSSGQVVQNVIIPQKD